METRRDRVKVRRAPGEIERRDVVLVGGDGDGGRVPVARPARVGREGSHVGVGALVGALVGRGGQSVEGHTGGRRRRRRDGRFADASCLLLRRVPSRRRDGFVSEVSVARPGLHESLARLRPGPRGRSCSACRGGPPPVLLWRRAEGRGASRSDRIGGRGALRLGRAHLWRSRAGL